MSEGKKRNKKKRKEGDVKLVRGGKIKMEGRRKEVKNKKKEGNKDTKKIRRGRKK